MSSAQCGRRLLDLGGTCLDSLYESVGLIPIDDEYADALEVSGLVTRREYESDGEDHPAFVTLTPVSPESF
jgi:hypothetical protein